MTSNTNSLQTWYFSYSCDNMKRAARASKTIAAIFSVAKKKKRYDPFKEFVPQLVVQCVDYITENGKQITPHNCYQANLVL